VGDTRLRAASARIDSHFAAAAATVVAHPLGLGPMGRIPISLTYLNVSSAKLSSLDDLALGQLTSLEELILDRNKTTVKP
jgi:Leucine-rich repeat (LRR) protein